jgi:hypothetical protein
LQFSASPLIILNEVDRKAACSGSVEEIAACTAASGTTITYDIGTDGRYTIFLNCPDAIPMCYFKYSNTAGNNMKAFELTGSALTNENVIKQEINTYGEFKFRKSTKYLMFVSLDSVNP